MRASCRVRMMATWVCGVLICALAAPATFAQEARFAIEQWEPMPAQDTAVLNLGTSKLLPHLVPSFGLVAHYQHAPLVLKDVNADDEVRNKLIEGRLTTDVWAALGLYEWVEVGLVLPLVPYSFGDSMELLGTSGSVDAFSAGDLRFVPKVRILDPEQYWGFGLTIVNTLYIPTGNRDAFASDGYTRWEPRLTFDYVRGDLIVTLNLSYQLRPQRRVRNIVSDDCFRWGVGAQVPLIEKVQLLASLWGSVAIEPNLDPNDLRTPVRDIRGVPIEGLVGVRVLLPEDLQLQAGAGAGFTQGVGTPQARVFVSIGWADHTGDRDADGVDDDEDRCPDEPEDLDEFEDEDGCPDLDDDRDGVPDAQDRCPTSPEDLDGFEDEDGCLDLDNDQDGLLDHVDQCPDEPEDEDFHDDEDGCPDLDDDGDGVPDAEDECKTEPEDPDGWMDHDGCPEADNDRDGILDGEDKCPNQAETKNGYQDDDGCPDTKVKGVRITRRKIELDGTIYFKSGKAQVKKKSHQLLIAAARVIKDNPQITLLRIEGHTDNVGPPSDNLKLSQGRAKAVVDFLVEQGVEAKRLASEGYGETRPVCQEQTRKCRATNRRTELVIVEIDGQPVEPEPKNP